MQRTDQRDRSRRRATAERTKAGVVERGGGSGGRSTASAAVSREMSQASGTFTVVSPKKRATQGACTSTRAVGCSVQKSRVGLGKDSEGNVGRQRRVTILRLVFLKKPHAKLENEIPSVAGHCSDVSYWRNGTRLWWSDEEPGARLNGRSCIWVPIGVSTVSTCRLY